MKENKSPRILQVGDITIEVAAMAGFCFGVARAVEMTNKLLAKGTKVATLGALINNPQACAQLASSGALLAENIADVPKDSTVIIRSHGVDKKVYNSLQNNNMPFVDATCPFVSKIHEIAEQSGEEKALLLVAGDAAHPEVQGITGHATGAFKVFENMRQLKQILSEINPDILVWVVAQTTHEVTKWVESTAFIKKVCTNTVVFDTICSATWTRQQEAEALAKSCDFMVVVGGKGSSNTCKLFNVASAHTKAVHIETASELSAGLFKNIKSVGVTAGASTPASLIEEVLTVMSDLINDGEKSFEEMLEESMKPVYAGQVVEGVVEAVSVNEVTVDIGTKQTGIIRLEELTDDPVVRSAEELVKRGDEIELVVVKVNDQDGIIYLSKRQLEARKGAEEVSKAAEDGTVMDGYVVESNKGGLVALVKGVKVFIPASQATVRRGEDYTLLVRKHVKLRIKEFSPRRTIGSIRDVLAEAQGAQREKFWSGVEEGAVYVGIVKSLTSYGAFVDIGGVDGLVHISELSWSRIKHPSEVVSVGDSIEVYVKELDRENQKVSLGFKKQADNPWEKLKNDYPVGSDFKAIVVSLTQFGAFVRILPGIDGLVHISEISYERVDKVADALSVGQEVDVKLLDVDYDRKRISLSMKALLPVPESENHEGEDEVVASASSEETTISTELETEE